MNYFLTMVVTKKKVDGELVDDTLDEPRWIKAANADSARFKAIDGHDIDLDLVEVKVCLKI